MYIMNHYTLRMRFRGFFRNVHIMHGGGGGHTHFIAFLMLNTWLEFNLHHNRAMLVYVYIYCLCIASETMDIIVLFLRWITYD